MRDPFDPAEPGWTSVSPALATGRILIGGLAIVAGTALLTAAVALVLALTDAPPWPGALPVLAGLGALAWLVWWAPRNRGSWGYREEEVDLVVRSGLLFRRLVTVPYGRMQFVDVSAGPVARRLGYASVTLHTASTETAATVPGVPSAEATRLRNRLTELGTGDDSGL